MINDCPILAGTMTLAPELGQLSHSKPSGHVPAQGGF